MGEFNQEDFNSFVLDNNVMGFFEEPIKLKSGRMSNWYVNWRNVAQDVTLLDKLIDHVIDFTVDRELNPDCFYGVPEGATPLGILTQREWVMKRGCYPGRNSLLMGRGKPKDHGEAKDRYFIGNPEGKVVVLEDVTTTGDSLISAIDHLQETEAEVIAAIGLTNRMEYRGDGVSVEKAVGTRGVRYFDLSNAFALLPLAYKRLNPGEDIGRAVEQEFEDHGLEKLSLV